jgi:nucleoside-diphosphate-sugar epimerase
MKRFFVTGGTGFFGKSILSRIKGRDDYDLTVLSRDPAAFRAANPAFAALPFVRWVAGDVRGFDFAAVRGDFDAIIHAATPATTTLADDEMTSIIVEGTERVIVFARDRAIKTILFTSSGAVYGPQTAPVSEDAPCAPTTAYGRGKLAAEKMLLASGLDVRIARCFAFTGPYLNRKIHYAIGNFIQNALDGQPIVIKGDGTPQRSYLYADDLVDWLFAILERGVPGRAYNVGSSEAISIRDLAFAVRDALGASCDVQILGTPTNQPPQVYVPVTTRIERELGVRLATPLAAAIQKSV